VREGGMQVLGEKSPVVLLFEKMSGKSRERKLKCNNTFGKD